MVRPVDLGTIVKVSNMLRRLLTPPNWMPNPTTWTWRRPDGNPQGFGVTYADDPGMANLLWLTMDLAKPPEHYNGLGNALFTIVLLEAHSAKLGGAPLLHLAALKTLREFHDMLPESGHQGNRLERMYPLLKMLAAERLRNADTRTGN